jgi:uncharacterized membrane protein
VKLSEAGEARVRGYLFVLGRALRSFLPREVAADALREIESHIRERVEQVEAMPNEQDALERVLAELGPPLRVAQAYSAEITVDEALTTGRLTAIGRALWQLATTSVNGFFGALGLFAGYTAGVAFLLLAVLKPLFPANVGLFVKDGVPVSFGAIFPVPAGSEVRGGLWIVVPCALIGLGILVAMQRASRAFLARWRARRQASDALSLAQRAAGPAPER